jgi:septum formation protein
MTPIVLASASASRAAILRGAGVPFSAVASGFDEDRAKARLLAGGASPRDIAVALADEKALAVSGRIDALVIGADQTLALDGVLHDKTADVEATRARLECLRGRTHSLHAAVAVARGDHVLWRDVGDARMTVRAFSPAFLDDYMGTQGEALASSLGGYCLEGAGAQLFDEIEGDYFSILGLPLVGLLGFLRQAGGLPQ